VKKDLENLISYYDSNYEVGLLTGMSDIRLHKYGKNNFYTYLFPTTSRLLYKSLLSIENFILLIPIFFLIYFNYQSAFMFTLFFLVFNIFTLFFYNKKYYKMVLSNYKNIELKAEVLRDSKKRIISADELVPGDILFLKKNDIVYADGVILKTEHLIVKDKDGNYKKEIGDEIFKYQEILCGTAKVLVTKTGKECKNHQTRQIDKYTIPKNFKRYYQMNYIFNLALAGILIMLKEKYLLPAIFLGITASTHFLYFYLNLISILLKEINKLSIYLNNIKTIFLPLNHKQPFIINNLDPILDKKYMIKKILVSNKLIEVTGKYNGLDGDFYRRDLKILKSIKWEEEETELSNKYSLYLRNRKYPNPFDKFTKSSPKKDEAFIFSLLTGEFTSLCILNKSLDGTATYDGSPVDNAFKIIYEKSKINIKDYTIFRQEKSDLFDIAVAEYNKKYYIFVKGIAEVILKQCRYIQNNRKKSTLNEKIDKKLKQTIKLLSAQSHKVYATAFKRLDKNDFNKIMECSDINKFVSDLTFTALFGIKVIPSEQGKKLVEDYLNPIFVCNENKELVSYILKKIGINNKEIVTQEEVEKFTEIDFLNKKDKIVAYVNYYRDESKKSLLNFVLKYFKGISLLLTHKYLKIKNSVNVLYAKFSDNKDKIKSNIMISSDYIKNSILLLKFMENFHNKVKVILNEKLLLNIFKTIFFGTMFVLIYEQLSMKLCLNLMIISILLETFFLLFYNKNLSKTSLYKNFYVIQNLRFFLLSLIFSLLLYYFRSNINFIFIIFPILLLDFFIITDGYYGAVIKSIIFSVLLFYLPYINKDFYFAPLFSINTLIPFIYGVFLFYIHYKFIKKRSA